MLTPMRQVLKSDIRENFTNKKESMGICFLNGLHYTDFLKSQGVDFSSGDIVNNRSQIIGQHNGIARYTIGQRRGVGIPEGMRVTGLDATNNRLIVGDNNELYKQKLYINECRITNTEELLSADDITIMIRGIGRNPEHPVKVKQHANGYCVICDDPAWAPAVGQPLVFYRKNLVIGGGIICSFE
jgi:tRNA-specific 2-thiouridylase